MRDDVVFAYEIKRGLVSVLTDAMHLAKAYGTDCLFTTDKDFRIIQPLSGHTAFRLLPKTSEDLWMRSRGGAGRFPQEGRRWQPCHTAADRRDGPARRAGRGERMVTWNRVSPSEVQRAIEEYDRLGPEQFFSTHGFGPSRSYELVRAGRHYPHKAILGTAYEFATGERLNPGDFEGGKAGAVRVLERLGYDIRPIKRA